MRYIAVAHITIEYVADFQFKTTRLSAIKKSSVILMMRDGNIAEQGSYRDLLAENSFYRGLYNAQFAAAETGK